MNDLEEARRLMVIVAAQATSAGPIDAGLVIQMAKVWAHIALAAATWELVNEVQRIADATATNK